MAPAALHEAFELVLPCNPHAPAKVRRELDRLEGIDSVRDEAQLVATEIVTNAVLHSGCTPEHEIKVCARVSTEELEVSVHDPALAGDSRQDDDPADADVRIGGLGLVIVDRLAHTWGMRRPDGLVVWARLLL
jgi:anti-sigma regulatory factor (Ser/Thr protein kinase)